MVIDVPPPEVGQPLVRLKATRLLSSVESKFVPEIVTAVPEVPIAGEKPEMVGAVELPTTNDVLEVAEPVGVVTAIVPLVAPDGTVATRLVAVDDVTVADVALNETEFWEGLVLNPCRRSVPWSQSHRCRE